jgi:hypothetical protein
VSGVGSNLGTSLTGIDYVFLVVPVALVLAGWIFFVLRADTHPDVRHVGTPRTQVPGGSRLPGTGDSASAEVTAEPVMATGAADESAPGEGAASYSQARDSQTGDSRAGDSRASDSRADGSQTAGAPAGERTLGEHPGGEHPAGERAAGGPS